MARTIETPDTAGVTTVNPMLALDGSKKQFCVGCGGPRDVKYAETHRCFCCGSYGTQKTQPEFDEHGERIPDEVVAARRQAEREARAAARAEAAPAEEPAALKVRAPKPAPEAARTSVRQPNAQVLPKPKTVTAKERKQAAASTLAALF